MYGINEILKIVEPLAVELADLLQVPRERYSQLAERDVPESAGLYVIYRETPLEVLYVGLAKRRGKTSDWGQPDGLRFRIMKNHLAYQGNDNFIRYVTQEFALTDRPATRTFVKNECSVHWRVLENLPHLFQLEHFAIAALRPRLNKG